MRNLPNQPIVSFCLFKFPFVSFRSALKSSCRCSTFLVKIILILFFAIAIETEAFFKKHFSFLSNSLAIKW